MTKKKLAPPKPAPHPVKRRILGKKRAAAAKAAAPARMPRPPSQQGRALDDKRRGPVRLFEALGKLAEFVGTAIVLAVRATPADIRAAGGSLIEAMSGHRCGPECWHALGDTPEEKQAWWDKTLADYDARVAGRAPPFEPRGIRCVVRSGMTQCAREIGHKGAHQDEKWNKGEAGAVSWW